MTYHSGLRGAVLSAARLVSLPTLHAQGGGGGGVSAADVATANNPLANVNAISFQNYYAATLFGISGIPPAAAPSISPEATTAFAIGPQFVAPTATNSALGSGKWLAGAAADRSPSAGDRESAGRARDLAALVDGDRDRPATDVGPVQPFLNLPIGGGFYFRSTASAKCFA